MTRRVCAGSRSTKSKEEPAALYSKVEEEAAPHCTSEELVWAIVTQVTTTTSGWPDRDVITCCGVVAGMAAKATAPAA